MNLNVYGDRDCFEKNATAYNYWISIFKKPRRNVLNIVIRRWLWYANLLCI